jgi:hypothetical protein
MNTVSGQSPPGTDIFLADLTMGEKGLMCKNIEKIIDRKGYDNQPSFSPDGRYVYYSSIHEDLQADVYRYDVKAKKITQVTKTKEDEYSPTVMNDAKHFSVVRVEEDSTQRLWKFKLDGSDAELVHAGIDSVGYHCWIDNRQLALFILTDPFTLQLCNTEDSQIKILAQNIGRSIHQKNGNMVLFTQLIDSVRWICSVSIKEGKVTKLIQCLEGSEDFAIYNDHVFLMAKGNKIFQADLNEGQSWKTIVEINVAEVKTISRIKLSADKKKLAFVSLE